jgi:hypothetical protein
MHKKVHGSWLNFLRLINIIINASQEKCEDRHDLFLRMILVDMCVMVDYILISTMHMRALWQRIIP